MAYAHTIGVDPGLEGGLAVLKPDGTVEALAIMPRTEDGKVDTQALKACLEHIAGRSSVFLAVEKVWAFPGQGVVSVFTFGRVTGQVIGALEAIVGVRATEIAPQTWQKGTFGTADDPKEAARAYVAEHFPGVNLKVAKKTGLPSKRVKNDHQGLVDALAIADFARLNHHLFT